MRTYTYQTHMPENNTRAAEHVQREPSNTQTLNPLKPTKLEALKLAVAYTSNPSNLKRQSSAWPLAVRPRPRRPWREEPPRCPG